VLDAYSAPQDLSDGRILERLLALNLGGQGLLSRVAVDIVRDTVVRYGIANTF
jgi:hypothetical protein